MELRSSALQQNCRIGAPPPAVRLGSPRSVRFRPFGGAGWPRSDNALSAGGSATIAFAFATPNKTAAVILLANHRNQQPASQQGDDGSIESGDDLGVGAPPAIVPVRDCPHRLPFKRAACPINGESKVSPGTVDGADSAEASGKARVNRDGHVKPAARQSSFAPASLFGDK